jgi:hypothetical protein
MIAVGPVSSQSCFYQFLHINETITKKKYVGNRFKFKFVYAAVSWLISWNDFFQHLFYDLCRFLKLG